MRVAVGRAVRAAFGSRSRCLARRVFWVGMRLSVFARFVATTDGQNKQRVWSKVTESRGLMRWGTETQDRQCRETNGVRCHPISSHDVSCHAGPFSFHDMTHCDGVHQRDVQCTQRMCQSLSRSMPTCAGHQAPDVCVRVSGHSSPFFCTSTSMGKGWKGKNTIPDLPAKGAGSKPDWRARRAEAAAPKMSVDVTGLPCGPLSAPRWNTAFAAQVL